MPWVKRCIWGVNSSRPKPTWREIAGDNSIAPKVAQGSAGPRLAGVPHCIRLRVLGQVCGNGHAVPWRRFVIRLFCHRDGINQGERGGKQNDQELVVHWPLPFRSAVAGPQQGARPLPRGRRYGDRQTGILLSRQEKLDHFQVKSPKPVYLPNFLFWLITPV